MDSVEPINECNDDSFDAVVLTSATEELKKTFEGDEDSEIDEEMEEDVKEEQELDLADAAFDLLTIEKVPMKMLTTRIGRVVCEVMHRGEPAAVSLFDVACKIVFQSTMLDEERNGVICLLVHGLTRIILDHRERDERAEKAELHLMLLITKIAVRNKAMKCDDLLLKLIYLIDRIYLHADSFVRARVCRLISLLVEESNRYADAMREQGDYVFLCTDEDPVGSETIIPEGVKKRWLERLAKSLLDKSPQVRGAAVIALSFWDYETIYKTRNCDELSVNDLIWRSIHDVDESVRLVASKRVHVADEKSIDKCMDYVETSKENRIRQAIVMRLASNVHLVSYTNEQRYRLINLLRTSASARLQDVIQRLVDAWIPMAAEEFDYPSSFFPPTEYEIVVPDEFPSIIFEYLNPQADPQAVYIFMKFATVRYIHSAVSASHGSTGVNLEDFMKNLLKMTDEAIECVGLMKRSTFRLVEDVQNNANLCLKQMFARVFLTRCFVDVVFDLSKGRLDVVSLRNRALSFFTPDVTTFCQHLEEFCSEYCSKESISETMETCEEVILFNVFHLINLAVKHGDNDFDRDIYQKSLKRIIESPLLEFSIETIIAIVSTILDLEKSNFNNKEESETNWICEVARKLLLTGDDGKLFVNLDLKEAMKEGVVCERMYLRSAVMLLATCKHDGTFKSLQPMSTLFRELIPALLGNSNGKIQNIGLELIGYASSIDFKNCGVYLKLTQFLIERNDPLLKSTGLGALIRVIKANGFPATAEAVFGDEAPIPQENQELLAKLIEKTLIVLQEVELGQAVFDCLSMLSYGKYAWPKLMSVLLLIIFQTSNQHLQLNKIFKAYCKKSVKSLRTKINLLVGLDKAIGKISKLGENEASLNLGDMTTAVCECVSRVQTVGEEEDSEGDCQVEIELAKRMIKRSVAHPSGWFVRHVFSSLATSLRLECVPLEDLRKFRDELIDSYNAIRFHCGKTTQIAVKRFLTNCEKIIHLQAKIKGLELPVDLKKVKTENENAGDTWKLVSGDKKKKKESKKSSSNEWNCEMFSDSDDENKRKKKSLEKEWDDEDSFEYFPQSTRTRKRPVSASDSFESAVNSPKKSRNQEETLTDHGSFEF